MTSERLRVIATWVVAAVIAVIVLLASRASTQPAREAARPPAPRVVPAAATVASVPPAPPTGQPTDAITALAAAGTCADRDAAAERLRALGDPTALPALHRALRDARGCAPPAIRRAIRELAARRGRVAY